MQRCCSTQHCNWWDFEHIELLVDETANDLDPIFQRLSCRIRSTGWVFLLRRKTLSGPCRTVCAHHSNGGLNSRCLYHFWICAHWKCRTIWCHKNDFLFNIQIQHFEKSIRELVLENCRTDLRICCRGFKRTSLSNFDSYSDCCCFRQTLQKLYPSSTCLSVALLNSFPKYFQAELLVSNGLVKRSLKTWTKN